MGCGLRSSVVKSSVRSTSRCRAVRMTLARTCWVCAPRVVRLPPQILRLTTAGRMACSARQLVASTSGAHKKAKTAANSRSRWAAKRWAAGRAGAVSRSRPEAREQAPAGHGEAVIGERVCRPSAAEREGVGEDRLHAGRPRTVRMIRGQRACPT